MSIISLLTRLGSAPDVSQQIGKRSISTQFSGWKRSLTQSALKEHVIVLQIGNFSDIPPVMANITKRKSNSLQLKLSMAYLRLKIFVRYYVKARIDSTNTFGEVTSRSGNSSDCPVFLFQFKFDSLMLRISLTLRPRCAIN